MCILLDSKVVLSNAFFARSEEEHRFIEMNELRDFCGILYDKITQRGKKYYKYVCFQVDEEDIEEFCRYDDRFAKGINKIYTIDKIHSDEVNRINSIYSQDIQQSIESAREAFSRK